MVNIKGLKGFGVIVGALVLFAAGFMLPTNALAGNGLTRLSARNTGLDGSSVFLPAASVPSTGGINFYSNTLKIPGGNNVVYVSLFATGLTDNTCDGLALNCQVDGANCLVGNGVPGSGLVASIPNGWVIPLGDEFDCLGDLGDTGLSFQFCAPITKGNHTITLNAASAFGSGDAFLEAAHIYVDVNNIKNVKDACATYATPNPGDSGD